MSVEFEVTFQPADEDTRRLARELQSHAADFIDTDGFESVAVFLRDDKGDAVGGVSGYLNWNWLQVSLLWVDESLRGEGYGEKLMTMIEDLGREKGCTRAHLSTFSFQAKAFYESLGYEVFATLDDYPPGHARSFMRKVLQ